MDGTDLTLRFVAIVEKPIQGKNFFDFSENLSFLKSGLTRVIVLYIVIR